MKILCVIKLFFYTFYAVTKGGNSRIGLVIGFSFLLVGTIGFVILKIKEKQNQ